MSQYRNNLPQLSDELFLTDGGLETTLIFKNGYDLPEFAAFSILKDERGYETLRDYYHPYVKLAKNNEAGFILESATWRASKDWGIKLGYTSDNLYNINRVAISILQDIRNEQEDSKTKIVISGCLGPRGDGYNVTSAMIIQEARNYHEEQIKTFSELEVDIVSALTMNYTEEAIGVVLAAKAVDMPVSISFTVETDGRLPSGISIKDAITIVDEATDSWPAYYMINCAHPTHFIQALAPNESWLSRIRGIRANASEKSHAELDETVELDAGNPIDLGKLYNELMNYLPKLNIVGGCCGTDHHHLEEIYKAVTSGN